MSDRRLKIYNQKSALEDILICIDSINEQLPLEHRISKDLGTLLLGEGSVLDSLSLINLMVEIEEIVSIKTGKRLAILEGALMRDEGGQFFTVEDLAKWIVERIP